MIINRIYETQNLLSL